MTEELKTLKELGSDSFCGCGLKLREPCLVCGTTFKFKPSAKVFTEEELRQEAIKWLHELTRNNRAMGKTDMNSTRHFIIHFFNLTKEELK